MAFDLTTNARGAGRAHVRPSMNVTPLVDVVLVLLIIFMVITPMLLKQFWLHVPNKDDESKVEPPLIDSRQPVVLTVTPEGRAQINKVDIDDAELSGRLRRIFAARKEHVLFFDASDELPFGRAMEVMDLARGGGALTIVALHEPVE